MSAGPKTRLARRAKRTNQETAPSLEFENSWAFIIGINAYTNSLLSKLATAVNDAQRLHDILQDEHHYKTDLLLDEHATLAELSHRLDSAHPDSWAKKVGENDRVLFYFAGHGIALDSEDGPAGYLVPQDADPEDVGTFLEMTKLHDALLALPCRHLLIILDCCFAGAMRWSTTRAVHIPPKEIHKERYNHFIKSPARQLITSAASDQEALDVLQRRPFDNRRDRSGQKHSPFAVALYEALEGKADVFPDGEGDGLLTAHEMYQYVRDFVEFSADQQYHTQTPDLWPLKDHRNGEFVFRIPGRDLSLPDAPPLNFENNPYRGLNAFEAKHHKLFFGRQRTVRSLLQRIEQNPLTVVLGASGTGKSSVVKAGVLPALSGNAPLDPLKDQNDPLGSITVDPTNWQVLSPIRPTDEPLLQLYYHLDNHLSLPSAPGHDQVLVTTMQQSIADWVQNNTHKKLVLVIDQFEELVTLCRNSNRRNLFLNFLATVVEKHPNNLRLVITLRSDFEPQFTDIALTLWWDTGRYIVPPLSQAELKEVIEGPASVRVLYFDPPSLVDTLVEEVSQTPGALPLLSFALSEMYINYVTRKSNDRALTLVDYEALGGDEQRGGGVIGALRNRATKEYDRLDEACQATMQRIMLRMVSTRGGELARRRVPLSELEYTDPAENDRKDMVIERLTEARLLVHQRLEEKTSEAIKETYIEPAHDALVRAWDRLLHWRREAEDQLVLQQQITAAAEDWDQETNDKHKQALLWHGNARLPQAQQILLRKNGNADISSPTRQLWEKSRTLFSNKVTIPIDQHWLNRLESDFITQSILTRRKNQRRTIRISVTAYVVLIILMMLALYQCGQAEIEAERAANQSRYARIGELSAQSQSTPLNQTSRSLLLAIEAFDHQQSDDPFLSAPNQAILDALQRPLGEQLAGYRTETDQVIISPDGQWLAARQRDSSIHLQALFQPDLEPIILPDQGTDINSIAFSPDDRWLASGSNDGLVRLWSVEDPKEPPKILAHNSQVSAIHFSPNNTWLATGSGDDGLIQLWSMNDLAVGPKILEALGDIVLTFDFTSDETKLIAGGPVASLWNLETFEKIAERDLEDLICTVAFHPNGHLLALGDEGGTAWLWETSKPDLGATSIELRDDVTVMTFNPTGDKLSVGTGDGFVRVLDADDEFKVQHTYGAGEAITSLTFTSDGNNIISSSTHGETWRWPLNSPPITTHLLPEHDGWVYDLAFTPDSRQLITVSEDSNIRLWSMSDFHQPSTILTGHTDWLKAVAISDDGTLLATGGHDRTIRLWGLNDASDEPIILSFDQDTSIESIDISPTNEWMIAAGSSLWLWSLSDLDAPPQMLNKHFEGWIYKTAFSSDGIHFATAGADGAARLWSLADLAEPPIILLEHPKNMSSLAFSPDGQKLTAASTDGIIWVWSLDNLSTPPKSFVGHEDDIYDLAISPQQQWLASASKDNTVRLWPLFAPEALPVIFNHNADVLAVAFSEDGKWLATGSGDNAARLWSIDLAKMSSAACEFAGRNLTLVEWEQYFPEKSYHITCDQWPAHPTVTDQIIDHN